MVRRSLAVARVLVLAAPMLLGTFALTGCSGDAGTEEERQEIVERQEQRRAALETQADSPEPCPCECPDQN